VVVQQGHDIRNSRLRDTKVLLVEDHPHVRQMLGAFVDSQPGLSLEASFESAEAALTYIDDNRPEFVLADVRLPGINGVELIRKLHAHFDGQVVCLVISGQAHGIFAEQARLAGARGFVEKGDPEKLRLALGSVSSGEEYWQEML
jgi:DNA-binding NarL/FixJ family response regulator